jgi:UDP-N-acetylglucosamine--N-acetylmuramyl-(pentapeptide) pyrophosphoryl-undecaprenol N-acetylglucosamine transferase
MYRASGADPLLWTVKGFLDDMPARIARANLVLARSGASTVAELAAAGKPALLVPLAAAADDHQKHNALEMVAAGAAEMLEEAQMADPSKLLEALVALFKDRERLAAMSSAARKGARPEAAERIARKLLDLANWQA